MDVTRNQDPEKPVTADIYCRMSLVSMGDTTKVDDQERIAREIVARRGWVVGEVHKDNSVSAWSRTRKRKGWDAMLERVRDGLVGAIVCYHGDRLIRQPYDLEIMLNLAEKQGIRLAGVMGERNLDSSDDRFILRIEAAQACRESDNISRRTKAYYERRRREGLTRTGGRGGRCAGFSSDGITHIPAECEWIRAAAARLRDGGAIRGVARDLAADGKVTPAGNPVSKRFLQQLLRRPRLAGLMPDGKTKAAWEPVLDRHVWEDTVAVLDRKAAMFPGTSNARVHLLSGIAVCRTCGHAVEVGHRSYRCTQLGCGRRVLRVQTHLDEYVTGRVLALLADRRFIAGLAGPGNAAAVREIVQLERRRDKARKELEELADHPELNAALIAASLASFTRKIDEKREKMATTARARLLTAHRGLTRDGWDALPLATRRALVSGAVTVVILPAARRGAGFDPASVQVTPL